MKLIAVKDYKQLSEKAAKLIIQKVNEKPDAVLGLATGGTVVGIYEELIRDHKENATSYKHTRSVNLDEYIGLAPYHEQSYFSYMNELFFKEIDIQAQHTHLPNGQAHNVTEECERYEQLIKALGGIDLQLLGIGENGHIGFNEPGTSFHSLTHVVKLAQSTREANARFFSSIDSVPTHAITMGIATIMSSREIMLVVSGEKKAEILCELFTHGKTESIPATVLKDHLNVTVIADEQALSVLNKQENHTKLFTT
ncbi:glucosamine-6-phosphate deaminase [Metabacillus iocasae]|uniref:Glucosamine-6-phosphate deaminase n=1 Tax=Priestia iocasae TaxID=2291674 RepID=A0ABS2QW58_9BACI|nr:glucosamine-6-phosphate deaminase [Metabacillus iocasae]MBM7703710.1 glucosamine-6-phosphate deaminase [Metabacillus iocasae]